MAYRSSKCVINLAEKGGHSQRDKLDRRRSTNTPKHRCSTAVVYHSDRQALSTARCRRTGQLATANTCL